MSEENSRTEFDLDNLKFTKFPAVITKQDVGKIEERWNGQGDIAVCRRLALLMLATPATALVKIDFKLTVEFVEKTTALLDQAKNLVELAETAQARMFVVAAEQQRRLGIAPKKKAASRANTKAA